jgi:hypothetical protein
MHAGSEGARLLRNSTADAFEGGDQSEDDAFVRSRSVQPMMTKARRAVTPLAAEAFSNAEYSGAYRLATKSIVVATADEPPEEGDNLDDTVQPRTRSAQDEPKGPNLISGATQFPAIVVGNLVAAETCVSRVEAPPPTTYLPSDPREQTARSHAPSTLYPPFLSPPLIKYTY